MLWSCMAWVLVFLTRIHREYFCFVSIISSLVVPSSESLLPSLFFLPFVSLSLFPSYFFSLLPSRLLSSYEDDVDDRLRFFVEDCDSLQGFQLLVDASDGISGLGARLLEHLADEHAAKCTIAFPVSPGNWKRDDTLARTHRVANTVCSMHALTTHCDLVIPLTCGGNFYANDPKGRFPRQFPNTYVKPIYYHTSAVLATALESITSVYRRYENPISMSEFADMIGISGRKIAEANLALPFPLKADGGSLVGTLLEAGGIGTEYPPWQSVSDFVDPRLTLNSAGSGSGLGSGGGKRSKTTVYSLRRRTRIADVAVQSLHLAGVPEDRIKSDYHEQQQQTVGTTSRDNPLPRAISQCSTAEDVLRLHSSQIFPNCMTNIDVMRNPMKTESPFPHIFDHFVGSDGFMLDEVWTSLYNFSHSPTQSITHSIDHPLNQSPTQSITHSITL